MIPEPREAAHDQDAPAAPGGGPVPPEGDQGEALVPAIPEGDQGQALVPAIPGGDQELPGPGPYHIFGRDADSIDIESIDEFLDRQYDVIGHYGSHSGLSHASITSDEEEDRNHNIFSGDTLIRSFAAEREVLTTEVRQSMGILEMLTDAMSARVRMLDRRYNGPSPPIEHIELREVNADHEAGRREEGGEGGTGGGAQGGSRGAGRGEADGGPQQTDLRTTTI